MLQHFHLGPNKHHLLRWYGLQVVNYNITPSKNQHFNLSIEGPNAFLGLKFVFSKKATKIDEIFTVDVTLTT